MVPTLIFDTYQDFVLYRDNNGSDSTIKCNGVSKEFAELHPDYMQQNETNIYCFDCFDCTNCSDCLRCTECDSIYKCVECVNCKDSTCLNNCNSCIFCDSLTGQKDENSKFCMLEDINYNLVPHINNIHQQVLSSTTKNEYALDMNQWHTCATSHCRAGWVEVLAGKAGKLLANETNTLFAAMLIYAKSSDIKVPAAQYFADKDIAIIDIKRCAELEALEFQIL